MEQARNLRIEIDLSDVIERAQKLIFNFTPADKPKLESTCEELCQTYHALNWLTEFAPNPELLQQKKQLVDLANFIILFQQATKDAGQVKCIAERIVASFELEVLAGKNGSKKGA